jgi:hypothetical protein
MHYLAIFFLGAFFCNSVPHLSSGLQGRPFPTPFAKPHGVGDSSAFVNVLWGMANFLAALFLLAANPVAVGLNADFGVVVLGALAIGSFTALHFARVHAGRKRD